MSSLLNQPTDTASATKTDAPSPAASQQNIAWRVIRQLWSNPALQLLHGLLLALLVCFVLLHAWGWGGHLNPCKHPISTYTSSAPGRNFGTACMMLLGSIYLLIAGAMVRHIWRSTPGRASALLLAVAGALLFFVARYQTFYQPPNQPAKTWFQQVKERFLPDPDAAANAAREKEVAKAHDDMIIGSTACLLASQIALTVAFWSDRRRAALARWTAAFLPPTVVLFYGAFHWYDLAGLYQRLGFTCVLGWIAIVGRRFFLPLNQS